MSEIRSFLCSAISPCGRRVVARVLPAIKLASSSSRKRSKETTLKFLRASGTCLLDIERWALRSIPAGRLIDDEHYDFHVDVSTLYCTSFVV